MIGAHRYDQIPRVGFERAGVGVGRYNSLEPVGRSHHAVAVKSGRLLFGKYPLFH